MINIDSIKPGQIATFRMEKQGADVSLRKTIDTADGRIKNPLLDRLSQHTTIVANIAGKQTYERKLAKKGEAPKGGSSWWQWTEQDGIACHKTDKSKGLYVVVSPVSSKTVYLVDGREPNEAEAEIIKAAKLAPKPDAEIMCLSFSNLINLEG